MKLLRVSAVLLLLANTAVAEVPGIQPPYLAWQPAR